MFTLSSAIHWCVRRRAAAGDGRAVGADGRAERGHRLCAVGRGVCEYEADLSSDLCLPACPHQQPCGQPWLHGMSLRCAVGRGICHRGRQLLLSSSTELLAHCNGHYHCHIDADVQRVCVPICGPKLSRPYDQAVSLAADVGAPRGVVSVPRRMWRGVRDIAVHASTKGYRGTGYTVEGSHPQCDRLCAAAALFVE